MTGGTLSILGQIKAESGPNDGSQRAGPGTNQRCCDGQEACVFLHENEWIIFILMEVTCRWTETKGNPPPELRSQCCDPWVSSGSPRSGSPRSLPNTAARIWCVSLEGTDYWELLTASKKNLPDILMTFFSPPRKCLYCTHPLCVPGLVFQQFHLGWALEQYEGTLRLGVYGQ